QGRPRLEGAHASAGPAGPGRAGRCPRAGQGAAQGPPSTRELAAQALVLFAEPSTRSGLDRALADPLPGGRIYSLHALSMLGKLPRTERYERILRDDPSDDGVRPMMAAALARHDRPDPARLRKLLADYDQRKLDSARLGEIAPDFTLTDFTGKKHR